MTEDNIHPPKNLQRRKRTRDALLTAAQKLLSERSIDAVAVDDIVQAAGVAKGSFYNHFEDKQELASIIRDDIRQEIEALVWRANENIDDPAFRVVRGFSVYVGYILASQQRANVIRRVRVGFASTDNPMNEGILHDVAAGLRSGRFVVPSVASGALFVLGSCEVVLSHAVDEPNDANTLTIAQQLGALMLRGLGIPFAESESFSATAIHELAMKPAHDRQAQHVRNVVTMDPQFSQGRRCRARRD